MALKLRPVSPRQGAQWVRRGFQVFVRRPLGFCALLLSFFFVSMAVTVLLPWVGSVLALMAVPLLSLGFMLATQTALRGGPVHPGQLVEPVARSPRKVRIELLKLCAGYAVALIAIALITEWTVGNPWEPLLSLYGSGAAGTTGVEQPSAQQVQAALEDPRFTGGSLLLTLLVSLVTVPYWHAPALVLWGEQGAAQSLFSSTLACWKSKGAFSVYSLVWLALMFGATLVTTLLFTLLGAAQLAGVALLPLVLMGLAVFYVSVYFSFVDTFSPAE